MSDTADKAPDHRDTARVEAFSDGVFAVAITLLVLNLAVPEYNTLHARGKPLLDALLDHWPVYPAYLISFLTVLVLWVNHHNMFRLIGRTDHTLLILNGLLLLAITVIPFPTALLAEYIQHSEHHDQTVAAAIYSGTFTVMGILYTMVWRHASKNNRLIAKDADPRIVAKVTRRFSIGAPLYFLSFVLAFVNVWASVVVFVALPTFYSLPNSIARYLPWGELE